MTAMNSRIWRWAVCGLVLLPIGGCGIAADVLNTGFLTGLGLDTATIIPPQGSIIVAFNNTTKFPALFSAWESVDPVNLKRSSKNFSVEADGGQVKNQVLDCPIGAIAPGSLGANFTPEAQAAVVTVTDAQGAVTTTTVDYNGQPLESGIAYACGDVIEITLSQVTQASTTGQAQQSFAITVQVIPGR